MTTFRRLAFAILMVTAACKSEAPPVPLAAAPAKAEAGARVIALKVTEEGFEPSPISVKKGEPLVLQVTRLTDKTCATEILIDGTDINVPLPLHQAVEVLYTPSKSGQLRYGCAMGMMISGVLVVE